MLRIRYQSAFKHDFRRIAKRGKQLSRLERVIGLLAQGIALPSGNHDHALLGDYPGCRECHIEGDWLLVYRVDTTEKELILVRTGSHSDLY